MFWKQCWKYCLYRIMTNPQLFNLKNQEENLAWKYKDPGIPKNRYEFVFENLARKYVFVLDFLWIREYAYIYLSRYYFLEFRNSLEKIYFLEKVMLKEVKKSLKSKCLYRLYKKASHTHTTWTLNIKIWLLCLINLYDKLKVHVVTGRSKIFFFVGFPQSVQDFFLVYNMYL